MARVNGAPSAATIEHIHTDTSERFGSLFLYLNAPLEELDKWERGACVELKASWDLLFSASDNDELAAVMSQQTVQGDFVPTKAAARENRLIIRLRHPEWYSRCQRHSLRRNHFRGKVGVQVAASLTTMRMP